MEIERQDRRTVADQNLSGQTIAIAQAMHRLDFKARKILSSRHILKRLVVGVSAAGQQQEEGQGREAHRVY